MVFLAWYSLTISNTIDGPENGDIRLKYYSFNSIEYRRGRVEIYLSESWGAVVANTWTTANAEVVCRQLGYIR